MGGCCSQPTTVTAPQESREEGRTEYSAFPATAAAPPVTPAPPPPHPVTTNIALSPPVAASAVASPPRAAAAPAAAVVVSTPQPGGVHGRGAGGASRSGKKKATPHRGGRGDAVRALDLDSIATDDVVTDDAASADAATTPVLDHLMVALRDTRVAAKAARVWDVRRHVDRYTLLPQAEVIAARCDIDHILEVQVFARAVADTHVLKLAPYVTTDAFTSPLYDLINDVPNLNATTASVNRSKGQAMRLFMNRLGGRAELPLLACLQYEASGKQRQLFKCAVAISRAIADTAPALIDEVRGLRREGYVTSTTSSGYALAADTLQEIVDIMDVNIPEDGSAIASRTRAKARARRVYVCA